MHFTDAVGTVNQPSANQSQSAIDAPSLDGFSIDLSGLGQGLLAPPPPRADEPATVVSAPVLPLPRLDAESIDALPQADGSTNTEALHFFTPSRLMERLFTAFYESSCSPKQYSTRAFRSICPNCKKPNAITVDGDEPGNVNSIKCESNCKPYEILYPLAITPSDLKLNSSTGKAIPAGPIYGSDFNLDSTLQELSEKHLADLRKSGLSDEQIAACGYATITDPRAISTILNWHGSNTLGPCLVIPYFNADGSRIPLREFARLKPDNPRIGDTGKAIKYESPLGSRARLYFPPGFREKAADGKFHLLFTEGEKKAAKADQEGFLCVGLGGVESWSKPRTDKTEERELLSDFDEIDINGGAIFITFDSDLADKPPVQMAEWSFAHALRKRGADVGAVRLPNGPPDANGNPAKIGLDDYLLTHSVDDFLGLIEAAMPPEKPTSQASKTDPPDTRIIKNLEPGTYVLCGDRGNIGTVVSDDGGQDVTIHFVSPDGVKVTKPIPRNQLKFADGRSVVPTRFNLTLIPSRDFAEANYKLRYLIRHVLVEGQPCIVGGPRKGLKTGTMIDLAISLGTGTPFLGRPEFSVPEAVNVAILSGESGLYTLQETANRVAVAHGVKLADAKIWWADQLPSIANPDHLDVLCDAISRNGIKVCIIDPAYLCLLSGDTQGRQASNLFDVGALLMGLVNVGRETGCGIILAHHTRKNPAEPFAVPELEELAYAGFAEFARQWILLNRRSAYQGSGHHELWLAIGGSAGHSSTWAYDVEEGVPDEWFRGRFWDVTVTPASIAIDAAKERRERQKENDAHARRTKNIERIMEYLRQSSEAKTAKSIRESTSLSGSNFNAAWAEILGTKTLQTVTIKGANGRPYEAYLLATGSTGPAGF